jgi:hypothetical protein
MGEKIMKNLKFIGLIGSITITSMNFACELSVTNDGPFARIYISSNEKLAPVVSKETLEKYLNEKNGGVARALKKGTAKLKATNFHVYTPTANGMFAHHFHVKSLFCYFEKRPMDNRMTYNLIADNKLNKERFKVTDYTKERERLGYSMITPQHKGQPQFLVQPGGYPDIIP